MQLLRRSHHAARAVDPHHDGLDLGILAVGLHFANEIVDLGDDAFQLDDRDARTEDRLPAVPAPP